MKKLILLGIALGTVNGAFASQPQQEKFNVQIPAMAAHEITAGALALEAINKGFSSFAHNLQGNPADKKALQDLSLVFLHVSSFLNQLNRLIANPENTKMVFNQQAPELVKKFKEKLIPLINNAINAQKSYTFVNNLKTIEKVLEKTPSLVTNNDNALELKMGAEDLALQLQQDLKSTPMATVIALLQNVVGLIHTCLEDTIETMKNNRSLDTNTIQKLNEFNTALSNLEGTVSVMAPYFARDLNTGKNSKVVELYNLDVKYKAELTKMIVQEFTLLSQRQDLLPAVREKFKGLITEFTNKKTLLSSETLDELEGNGTPVSHLREIHNCNDGVDHSKHSDRCPCKNPASAVQTTTANGQVK